MVTAELRGLRILVTRAAGQARPLSSLLKAAGADVVTAPLIAFEPVGDSAALRRGIREWALYDHVVFTSATAVRAFAAAAGSAGVPLVDRRSPAPAVVAVGPATAKAVRQAGLTCHEVPRRFSGDAVAEMLEAGDLRRKRVLIPRAQVADESLPDRLRRAGARVDVLPLYRTVPHPRAPRQIPRLLGSGLDMITFTSVSAVDSFVAAAGAGFHRPPGLMVACIGPVTAKAADAAGLQANVVAHVHTIPGLVGAIREHVA